ncbi:NAD(P)-dependent alcohol dehydrogenase [Streptomyces sp. NPDC091272]|uniref:NAD(P)-dependent alcohol dehydrogenase n=1 Tax=Streptomyces sp. NPDC091272 TaxID=3365981 RepID=UPI0037F4169E
MTEMRAVHYDRYGPPEVLYVASAPVPAIAPDQVLVRVHAASVNGGELAARSGKLRLLTGRTFPQTTGVDFAGEVVAVGASVARVRQGDQVWGALGRSTGTMADHVAVSARKVARAPRNLSPVQAISLLAGGTTSVTALRDHAALKPAAKLLVRGASGGVGSLTVQIGKLFGAHVTALANGKNLDFVAGLGADEVLDYRTARPSGLGRFDAIVDTVGTDQSAFRRLLAPGGRMVAVAVDTDRLLAGFAGVLASTVHGSARTRFFSGAPESELLAEITRYAENGDIVPVVDTVHPLEGIADAHRALEGGGVRGKHIIQLM